MDFIDSLKQLSARVAQMKDSIQTEEATKNAFVLPFLRSLGYDVFDPTEVVPEMICDVGMKKGEKIDYAIMIAGEPLMLVECKHWRENLDKHSGQLFRYFGASKAKIGILTNGIKYRFYTDIDELNKMDEFPFLELDLEKISLQVVEAVKKFAKEGFSLDGILESASRLKYASDIERSLKQELLNPEPDFVRMLAKKTYKGIISPQLLEKFTSLVKTAASRIVDNEIALRLNSAMPVAEEPTNQETSSTSKIVTTDEEREGFFIIRSIACEIVPAVRVTMRDTLSYCGVLLDDKKTKQICRMYFNNANKRIAFVLPGGKEEFHSIADVAGIYSLKARILEAVKQADSPKNQN